MTSRRGVLRVGDRIRFEGEEHTVLALAGTTTRLAAAAGTQTIVTLSALLAKSDLELLDAQPRPQLQRIGLLDSLSDEVRARALDWERHIIEVETGLPPDAPPDAKPQAAYDPATTTLAQRHVAKAAELTRDGTPTSAATVQRMRLRYAKQGVWGLVDQRRARVSSSVGRADK